MAYLRPGGASFQQAQPFLDAQFDIFEWHTHLQSCVRYFLDHAQYNSPVQALAAFVNIRLPYQQSSPVLSSRSASSPPPPPSAPGVVGGSQASSGSLSSSSSTTGRVGGGGGAGIPTAAAAAAAGREAPLPPHHHHARPHLPGQQPPPPLPPPHHLPPHVTVLPYIRRLVATGFDYPAVLHGFFGDDWLTGIGPLHEQERRNYLFAAKSDTWLTVKAAYDMGEEQAIPFLRPLLNVSEKEIVGAEASWSEWLAMQDWMLGPREPEAGGGQHQQQQQHGGGSGHSHGGGGGRVRVKSEQD